MQFLQADCLFLLSPSEATPLCTRNEASRNDSSHFKQYHFNNFSKTDFLSTKGHRVSLKAFSYQTSKLYINNDFN